MLAHGWNATAYQIVNPGITRWFAAAGDAVVGYTAYGGVRVVAGAPVAADARLPAVTAEFEHAASRAGHRVCYFGAEQRFESACHERGYARVVLGAQPVWDPRTWPEIARRHRSLRAQLHRARNKGVSVTEWEPARAESSDALRRCLAEWLGTRGLPPLHFLVEPETLARLEDRRIFVAGQHGTPVAFLVASPVPGRRGWLVEQFVRGHASPNGATQMMVDAAMRGVAADGAEFVTLGLAPLSRRSGIDQPPNPAWLRFALAWVRAHGRRFYNFDGLDAFKARLQPEGWEPVYALAADDHFSPRYLYAIAGAFSGGSPVLTVARGLLRAAGTELRWAAEGR